MKYKIEIKEIEHAQSSHHRSRPRNPRCARAGRSAFAGWTKKKVCELRLSGAYVGDFERGPLGIGVKECREIDVLVPNNWSRASASGVNKTFSPSTNLKKK